MNNTLRAGRNFRGLINDIKRRPEDAAQELGVSVEEIEAVIRGERPITMELVERAAKIWSLNKRDFFLIEDDCPEGIRIMRKKDSVRTSRVMNRAGKPYYEYRDTVMSKVGQFRPEWIKELCVVDDNDPRNPDVQWNNGHFLHQFTYFVGPVNFYYKGADGEKEVAVMNTGDTMYIAPFVPHTFTTRKNAAGEEGLILALTYGNKIAGETQQELSALGTDLAMQFALDFRTREKTFGSLLTFYREALTLSQEALATFVGMTKEEISHFENGAEVPTLAVIEKLAAAVRVNMRELLPYDATENKVIVQKHSEGRNWSFPEETGAYKIVELSCTKNLPNSKALEFTLRSTLSMELDIKCGLHQYVYNPSGKTIRVNWRCAGKDYTSMLSPGDSCYIKPFVAHNFRGEGQLLVLRIGGRVGGEAMRELSLIGRKHTERAIAETMQWYDPKGKQMV